MGISQDSRLVGLVSSRRGIDRSGIGLLSDWQVPPFSTTNTQEPRTLYRRPLVLNLPTNHWESAHENIQCKSTNYQTSTGTRRAAHGSMIIHVFVLRSVPSAGSRLPNDEKAFFCTAMFVETSVSRPKSASFHVEYVAFRQRSGSAALSSHTFAL